MFISFVLRLLSYQLMSLCGTKLLICKRFNRINDSFRSCRTHPGSVKAMDVCPSDTSKLLILFEKGQVVLWNIVTKESERFAVDTSAVKCFSWHSDGKQFMCGHKDGSLSVWNLKKPKEIQQKSMPHSPGNSVACRPINHLTWTVNGEGEQMIIFTGGRRAMRN